MIYTFMYKVYLISIGDENKQYKIGYTRRQVEQRVKEFKTGNSNDFSIIDVFESKWGTKIEAYFHRKYKSKKINGEWFFLDEEEVKNFKEDCKKQHDILELITTTNTWYLEKNNF